MYEGVSYHVFVSEGEIEVTSLPDIGRNKILIYTDTDLTQPGGQSELNLYVRADPTPTPRYSSPARGLAGL